MSPSRSPFGAPRALEVGVDREVLEPGIHLPEPEPARDQRALAGGVHQHLAGERVAVGELHFRGFRVELEVPHLGGLADLDAVLPRVVEQDLVEAIAVDLVRGAGARHQALGERVAAAERAVGADELRRVLGQEPRLLDGVAHAQLVEQGHAARQERLADVEAWKRLALEQHDVPSALGQSRSDRGARRAPAHDDDVVHRGQYSGLLSHRAANARNPRFRRAPSPPRWFR